MTEDLGKIHNILIGILNEFIKIADKHGLAWFIDGGSLLGTIRHNGIIPWDDDIDIMMPRKDYELFLEYAEDELEGPYFLSTYNIEYRRLVKVFSPHATMGNMNTTLKNISNVCQNLKRFRTCITIDIFPFDNAPDDNIEYSKWLNDLKEIRDYDLDDEYEKSEKYDELVRKFENVETKRFGNFVVNPEPRKYVFQHTDYSSYTLMPFNDTEVRVQNEWKHHLDVNYPGWKAYYSINTQLHKTFIIDPDTPYYERSEKDYMDAKKLGYVDSFYKYYLKTGKTPKYVSEFWEKH